MPVPVPAVRMDNREDVVDIAATVVAVAAAAIGQYAGGCTVISALHAGSTRLFAVETGKILNLKK